MANLLPMCANAQLIFRSKLRYRATWRYFLIMEIATASEQLRRHRLSMCTKADNSAAWCRLFWRGSPRSLRFDRFSQQQRQAISAIIFANLSLHLLPSGGGAAGRGLRHGTLVGAGRPRVHRLFPLDPSAEALNAAKENLRDMNNVFGYHLQSVATIPLHQSRLILRLARRS